jgi:23S rRNA (uracil1939-C5)-methyltransferase
VKLRVESMVHGGESIARHEGRVVFLRGAAPGDLVEAEIFEESKNFARAQTLRVLERGAARVDAPCGIVEQCGGCPIQQVSYAAQLEAKESLLRDALDGFEYEQRPIVPSPQPFHYRRRAKLHRAPHGKWGFAQNRSNAIQPVEQCLLFEPLLQRLSESVGELPGATDISILAGTKSGALAVTGEVSRKRLEALPRIFRGVVQGNLILGDPVIADPPLANGARLRHRPDTFAQANRSMVPALQAEVARALSGAETILELFCGSGTLTLPLLSRERKITAIESAGPSLALLRRSADEVGLPIKLLAGDAAKLIPPEPQEAILLDPPRTGAASVMPRLNASKIVYVSCDAPTLGRDARLLQQRGYRLRQATPLDLFPQTAHFETVAVFER